MRQRDYAGLKQLKGRVGQDQEKVLRLLRATGWHKGMPGLGGLRPFETRVALLGLHRRGMVDRRVEEGEFVYYPLTRR